MDVKLLTEDGELYVLVRSEGRLLKERAMRRRLVFSVESGKVERVDPARAMALPGFTEIVARRGWR